jgi:adenine-specific DNA methylase
MKINLSRALKEKNRLLKKIKLQQEFISLNNNYSIVGDKETDKIDISETLVDLEKNIQNLISLKSEISKANEKSGISKLVIEMSELKGLASFYKNFSRKRMAKRLKNPVCRFHNESRCRLQHFRPEKY